MARPRKSHEIGMNMDSLMDALTNVVAVLILVLVLVQADAAKKVEVYLEALEPATEEELVENRKTLELLKQQRLNSQELMEAETADPAELEKVRQELLQLREDVATEESEQVAMSELKRLELQVRKERDTEQKETLDLQKEIEVLLGNLDDSPVLKAIPPVNVSIPDSRPIPDNAEIFYVLVRKDRVHFVDTSPALKEFEALVRRNRNKWKLETIKRQGADLTIYDQAKITADLKSYKFRSDQGHRTTIPLNPIHTRLAMDIYPDLEKGGFPVETLHNKQSPFNFLMRRLLTKRNAVVMYQVAPNAFDTYLLARKHSDMYRLPAGWDVYGDVKIRTWMSEYTVKRLKEPPPPNPDAIKRPPHIKKTLD